MESNNKLEGSALTESVAVAQSGFGVRLREARELLGLSIGQASERLYCDPLVVAALENEDVAALGADVYARGHLKRYSDFLKLPTPEMLGLYDQLRERPTSTPDLTRIARAERPTDPNKYLNWVYVILAGVLGAFVVYAVLQMPQDSDTAPAASGAGSVVTVPGSSAPAVANESAGAASAPAAPATNTVEAPVVGAPNGVSAAAAAASSVPANTAPGNTTAPAAVLTATPATGASGNAAAVADGRVRLALRSTGDCWTEVYDQDGRQLFFNVVKRGSRHEVAAQGPLRLVVGNANKLLLEVGGRELKIPDSLQRKGTALITIDAAGRMESGR